MKSTCVSRYNRLLKGNGRENHLVLEPSGQAEKANQSRNFSLGARDVATYLFTWNPKNWPWDYFDRVVAESRSGKQVKDHWSTGNNKSIQKDERFFMLRQGTERGIVASGFTTSGWFQKDHWNAGKQGKANYAHVLFDTIVPLAERLETDVLLEKFPEYNWLRVQASGVSIPDRLAERLERIWREHLGAFYLHSGEEHIRRTYPEGAVRSISVDAYERNPQARNACISHFGCQCVVCDFDFAAVYGPIGKDFIHVHHLNELASIGEEHEVDPVVDLRPVCPNCHAMLHVESPAISIEKLRRIVHDRK
jgi:5-methylcytosine-specific restriction protein A